MTNDSKNDFIPVDFHEILEDIDEITESGRTITPYERDFLRSMLHLARRHRNNFKMSRGQFNFFEDIRYKTAVVSRLNDITKDRNERKEDNETHQ